MKVLEINSVCGRGSTGVIAVEIADLLKQNGHECYIAYGQGTTTYADSFKIGTTLENKMHGLFYSRIKGLQGYGTICGTKRLIRWIKQIHPDIIHLHNLHGNYLSFPLLFEYLEESKIPVVWSLFDCWAITGKCTHFTESGCRKWETQCEECPQLHTSGAVTYFFDRTRKMYNDKRRLFAALPSLDVIVCSNWLKSEVQRSYLQKRPVHMIYNWIDSSKFGPIEDKELWRKYGLDPDKKILVSVSAFWTSNSNRFTDAVQLANILPADYQLVIVGQKQGIEIPSNIVHIPFVAGTSELSKLYSYALAFVGFSVEDTFGKVFAEAMLCGTPCIVFNSTACPEVVGDVGYVVEPHDAQGMLSAVKEIDKNGKAFYSSRCIEYVKKNYDYKTNVGMYLAIYEKVYSKKKKENKQ